RALAAYATEACGEGLTSPIASKALVGLRKVGEICHSDWSCETDLTCMFPPRSRFGRWAPPVGPGTCRLLMPRKAIGDLCNRGSWCSENSHCDDAAGRCVSNLREGESCTQHEDCQTRRCDRGICRGLLSVGDSCDPLQRFRSPCGAAQMCMADGRCAYLADLG